MVFILSAYYITNIYEKWVASPIIIAMNAASTTINEIPFPAVTICNMNQAKASVVESIVPGSDEDALLQSLCAKQINFTDIKSNNSNWTQFRKFLIKVLGTPGLAAAFYNFFILFLYRYHILATKFYFIVNMHQFIENVWNILVQY